MIPASHFGGLNHITVANLNAASAPIGMSASGQSGKHLFDQSITGFDPQETCAALNCCCAK
jgi:hypothetical protein